jgi:protein-arginine kinase activator protein McsA
MKCKNCGKTPAELTDIEVTGGKEIQMMLCEACVEDLKTYGEFTHGKYMDWSQGE